MIAAFLGAVLMISAAVEGDPVYTPEQQRALAESGRLLDQVAELTQRGERAQSIRLSEEALKIQEKVLDPKDPELARTLYILSSLYDQAGRPSDAKAPCKRALEILEKSMGEDSPATMMCMLSLAGIENDLSEFKSAEELYKRALKHATSMDEVGRIEALSGLGKAYALQKKFSVAEEQYRVALDAAEKATPQNPVTIANLSNDLGLALDNQEKFPQAEAMLRRSLKSKEQLLGAEHPSIAATLGNLAIALQGQAKYPEAIALNSRAIKINEKSYGPETEEVALSKLNLANTYFFSGDFAAADPLYSQSIKVFERRESNERLQAVLLSLARMRAKQGRDAEAESLKKRAAELKSPVAK